MPPIHFKRQKQHIIIADMQATFLHGVTAHCNCIFFWIFLHIIICKFTFISMNYMENVAELLTHAQTVDTMCSSLISVECLGMWLTSVSVFWPSGRGILLANVNGWQDLVNHALKALAFEGWINDRYHTIMLQGLLLRNLANFDFDFGTFQDLSPSLNYYKGRTNNNCQE